MYSIKSAALESIIIASKNIYPQEFFSMLGGKNRTIEELVIVPAIFGDDFASYMPHLVPIDREIIGTVHSHPSKYNHPSDADLESFRKSGEVHLIISHPYDFNTIRAFDNKGRSIRLRVVD
ncbi:MAG: Mov34/MPN/PAD-1 family protein [archaeon]|nr:Mov34/MPN/PAD-1 family protein [archaeon]